MTIVTTQDQSPSNDHPSHEIIIHVFKPKRTLNNLSIHLGLFKGSWELFKESQILVQELRMTVDTNSEAHVLCVENVETMIMNLLGDSSFNSKLRISTGKYLDSKYNPKYDNFLDLDVRSMKTEGREDFLKKLLYHLLKLNRVIKHYYNSDQIEDAGDIEGVVSWRPSTALIHQVD